MELIPWTLMPGSRVERPMLIYLRLADSINQVWLLTRVHLLLGISTRLNSLCCVVIAVVVIGPCEGPILPHLVLHPFDALLFLSRYGHSHGGIKVILFASPLQACGGLSFHDFLRIVLAC